MPSKIPAFTHRPTGPARSCLALGAIALCTLLPMPASAQQPPADEHSIVTPASGNGVPAPVAALPGQAPQAAPATPTGNPGQAVPPAAGGISVDRTYTKKDTIIAANEFFGGTTQGLAQAIEKVFSSYGQPNAYITGNEGGGAFIFGLRYGVGQLHYKGGQPQQVYWEGPSLGFDFGGNASKAFMLVYNLRSTDQLFQRFPGVSGSLYVVAGLGLNYVRANGITIAPIRTGVGLRGGANVGYLSFSPKRTWNPF